MGICAGRALWALGVSSAAVLSFACGDDGVTGAGGGSTTAITTTGVVATGTGGGAGCGPAPGLPSTEECKACTWQHCCDQSQACAADPKCSELAACVEECGTDTDCRFQNCFPIVGNQPLPVSLELELCQLESCQTECNVALPCDQAGPPDLPECRTCLAAECCDELQTAYSPDLLRMQLCQVECLDWQCVRDCELAHPATQTALGAFNECAWGPTCEDACTGGPYCGGISFGDASCSACATASTACCDLYAACSADIDCISYFNCHNACTTPTDCALCATLWPVASDAFKVAAENCLGLTCEAECPGLADACGLASGLASGTCADCVTASCCSEGAACGSDATCAALGMCIDLCDGDSACRADCETQFSGGLALYGDLDTCRTTSCTAECP